MVENHPRTRSRKNVEVIPSVNTIKSVENVVIDDEAEIEQEDEKPDDKDESDNEREESDEGVDHKDDGRNERDEVDTKVHHFLVPTHQETYQPFMRDFVPLGQDFPEKRIDRLRKELEGVMTITRE
ncbi:hypothetical protein K7X08_016783 [Anisodus acutangulus]|uniref:Uncharacterized protein n=1 Tax=Anisodus acutangulus TaxID=402998 RepID=A0A9Q1LTG3_9SOLA|nr:hypothetical protein K7X08_016783 [Anisodus acutangulus]